MSIAKVGWGTCNSFGRNRSGIVHSYGLLKYTLTVDDISEERELKPHVRRYGIVVVFDDV